MQNIILWDGTTSTDNPLTITLESDLVISPIFQKVKYSVKINIEGEDDWGSVTEEIISSGKKTDYSSGTVLKLTAVPSPDIAFYNWNKNVLDTLNPYQITVDGNKEIDVKFDYKIAKDIVGTWELNLDSENSHNIMQILVKLNKELSTSFVFATHDEKIMGYLRRIVHLDDGQISKDEKVKNPKYN